MTNLAGRNAFVTGAGSGIGRAIATSLAREGVSVAIADIDLAAAKETTGQIEAAGGRAVPVACDVTDATSLETAADEATAALGPIHLLANNAGAFQAKPFADTTLEDWQWLIDINVLGVVRGLHTFLPRMRAHGEPSHIVNTASVAGHIATGMLPVYTATKFAVVGLSECLRAELADSVIGVSVLCPGIVKTGLLDSSVRHRRSAAPESADASPMKAVIESGSDPADVGDQVARAIAADDFYIFTHPTMRGPFETRFSEILAAYRT